MKKFLLPLLALLMVTAGAKAQVGKQKPAGQKVEKQKQMVSECCLMQKGKMVHYKDGKQTPIVKEMDINGMKVMPDGTCKMKNGKTMKLKEGECCDEKGVIHNDCAKLLKKS